VTAGTRTDLAVFTDPDSVAVVGASADPTKWGYWLASGALRGRHRRAVHLVNSRAANVLGEPCFPSLADLPTTPELVALCVPAAHVPAVVDEGLRRGVRGFLGITAGIADEAALARKITAHGARLLGTNSLGIYDAGTDLALMWGTMTPGPLAIVSQSGQLGSELAALAIDQGIGVSRFVSIGNQSDVRAVDVLDGLLDHDETRVVAVYLESFDDGPALFDALARLRAAGKPVVLLTVGTSAAGARLARSHTGSMTAPSEIVDASCRRAGVVRARTPGEVVDIARMWRTIDAPRGNRVAVVGDSGGQCGVAADVATAVGLRVVALSDALADDLAARLPTGAATSNPVDLAGAGERDLATYAAITALLTDSGEVDAVVLTGYFGCYARDIAALAEAEESVVAALGTRARDGIPVVVHSMGAATPMGAAMWCHGVPAYERIEAALTALSGIAGTQPRTIRRRDVPTPRHAIEPGYWNARELLSECGVRFGDAILVRGPDDLVNAAGLRFPVVLKADWLEHKSEHGGVVTNLATPEALAAAFTDMHGRLGDGDYVVEAQDVRDDVVEILVGARRDPDLGPVVVVGAGGTETEIHHDTALEMAPVTPAEAVGMLNRLRCAPLLSGWRGRNPVDVAALARVVADVSNLIAARADVGEIELNPVRVAPDGAVAVDALVIAVPHESGR
jgi:acetate---CoA ligase (ADP-forming)